MFYYITVYILVYKCSKSTEYYYGGIQSVVHTVILYSVLQFTTIYYGKC